jgi:hypothetical protein
LAYGTFDPYGSLVPFDDALHDRQLDTSAFEVRRRVQALENAKKLVRVFHIKANAVVADDYGIVPIRAVLAFDHDLWVVDLACVLDGVCQQVEKHLVQQGWVSIDIRKLMHVPGHGAVFQIWRQFRPDLLDHVIEADAPDPQFGSSEIGELSRCRAAHPCAWLRP